MKELMQHLQRDYNPASRIKAALRRRRTMKVYMNSYMGEFLSIAEPLRHSMANLWDAGEIPFLEINSYITYRKYHCTGQQEDGRFEYIEDI